MDTVWIKLTLSKDYMHMTKGQKMMFMFGPGGIIQFCPSKDNENETVLIDSKGQVCKVKESNQQILNVIAKIRGTEGIVDGIEEQGEESQSETSPSEAQSEAEANN